MVADNTNGPFNNSNGPSHGPSNNTSGSSNTSCVPLKIVCSPPPERFAWYLCTFVVGVPVPLYHVFTLPSCLVGQTGVALQEGKRFRVVVMDSRPQLEGRTLLHCLLEHGIACSYVLLNAASYIMQEVTKACLPPSMMFLQMFIRTHVLNFYS